MPNLNYSSNRSMTIREDHDMYDRLENECRHWESVKNAKMEYRKRGMNFSDTRDVEKWVDVVTQIKALEILRSIGWDTDAQVMELWQLADGIALEDEETSLYDARKDTL